MMSLDWFSLINFFIKLLFVINNPIRQTVSPAQTTESSDCTQMLNSSPNPCVRNVNSHGSPNSYSCSPCQWTLNSSSHLLGSPLMTQKTRSTKTYLKINYIRIMRYLTIWLPKALYIGQLNFNLLCLFSETMCSLGKNIFLSVIRLHTKFKHNCRVIFSSCAQSQGGCFWNRSLNWRMVQKGKKKNSGLYK